MHTIFKFFSILLLGFTVLPLNAQTSYTVLHVNGTITLPNQTSALKVGDLISNDTLLSCANNKAWIILIKTTGEQYFAGPSSDKLNLTIPGSLQLIEHTTTPTTRESTEGVKNLRTYFGGAQFVFIGNDFYLEVDEKNYLLDEQHFLLYRYEYQSRIITHKIPQSKQVIHLNKNFLYEHKGDTIPYTQTSNTEITYFNAVTNLPAYAAGLRPIWLNEEELKNELFTLKRVVQAGKRHPKEDLKKIFLQYVEDIYGKTDKVIFYAWVEEKVL